MSILSTTLTTLTFSTTLPLLLHELPKLQAGMLLCVYHVPTLFIHPYILKTNHVTSARYNHCAVFAAALFLVCTVVNTRLFRAFAYLFLGVGNSGLQTIAAISQPPNTLSLIDLLGTVASSLAPFFYVFHNNPYIPFTLLFVSFLTTLSARDHCQETDPLLKTNSDTWRERSSNVITFITLRPLSMMLFSTASLSILLPTLATAPSPTALSLLALSALSEPLSANLLYLGATRVTLVSTAITAIGTYLIEQNLHLGTILLGAGASATAVVSVADMTYSAGIVFDIRSPILFVAGITFAMGHILGCLIGGFVDISIWRTVSILAVFVAATPFLTPLLRSGVSSLKSFFGMEDTNDNVH